MAGTFTNTIRAQSGSVTGFATVIVTVLPVLTAIALTPNPAVMLVNATQQFSALGTDASGNPFAIAPVWAVVAGGGTINASGLFTAGAAPGTFTNTISATSGGKTGFATVIIVAGGVPPLIDLGSAAANGR